MNKAKALRSEINDILVKPMPWGPMVIDRARTALHQSVTVMDMMMVTINELQERMRFYENIRTDARLERNIEILRRHEAGETQAKLSREFSLSKQRIQRICMMTRKHIEGKRNGTQTEGLSGTSDTVSAQ